MQGKSGGLVFENSKAYDAPMRMPGGSKKKATVNSTTTKHKNGSFSVTSIMPIRKAIAKNISPIIQLQGKSGGLVFGKSKAYDAPMRMPGGSKKKAKEITEIYTTFLCLLNTKG